MSTAAHIEIPGIQAFIFRPATTQGTLLDTIGRSALVADLMREGTTNAGDPTALSKALARSRVAVVRRSAGALSVTGVDPDSVREFVRHFTREAREVFDSIDIVVALEEDYSGDLEAAARALLRARACQRSSAVGEVGHGVVRCAVTELAAESELTSPDGRRVRPVASEVHRARSAGRDAGSPYTLPEGFALTDRGDLIASQSGESTKAAVVAIDINRLGDRLAEARDYYADCNSVENPDQAMLRVGGLLTRVMEGLTQHLIETVANATVENGRGETLVRGRGPDRLEWSLPSNGAATIGGKPVAVLPIRPLITGGDDLVFVCESRLAWSLAEAACAYFDKAPSGSARKALRDDASGVFTGDGSGEAVGLTVSIGIAVAPRGYSLRSAHEIAANAEALAKSAVSDERATIHRIAWRVGSVRGDERSTRPAGSSSPYARRSAAWRNAYAEGLPRWEDLLGLLDPTVAGSLRSDQAAKKAAKEGATPWADQRTWLKSRAPFLIMKGVEVDACLESRGADSPLHDLPPAAKQALFVDALQLLDEHLTLEVS